MISRSIFAVQTNLKAQRQTTSAAIIIAPFRPFLAATLAAGMVLGSGSLLAQDVPPPPPDAGQQSSPQDNQPLPQYGAPVPSDNGSGQQPPMGQQGQPPQQQGQPLSADQLNQL